MNQSSPCRYGHILQEKNFKKIVSFFGVLVTGTSSNFYFGQHNFFFLDLVKIITYISTKLVYFKGGPADPSQQEKEHPTASKIHATLDSCPL
jgi:hypothetical protein